MLATHRPRRLLLPALAWAAGLIALIGSTPASAMPTYTETRVASEYAGGGTAQGWKANDAFWALSLPFQFPFYDEKHTTAYVGSNGYITFGSGQTTFSPDLATMKGILAYGTDLFARRGGAFAQDIRVASSPSEVKVTWNTETYSGTSTTGYAYAEGGLSSPATGQARGWKADDAFWALDLPFSFPFYGEQFSTAYVGSNGYVTFGAGSSTYTPDLATMRAVLGFGKDLITDCPDTDIHTFTSAEVVTIRWQARTYTGGCTLGALVNFGIALYPDGSVRMAYGQISDTAADQVVGISKGDSVNYITSAKDHKLLASATPGPEDSYSPSGGWPANFETVLKPSGEIRLRYGQMTGPGRCADVGVSRGDSVNYKAISGYDCAVIPSNAQTVVLTRQQSSTPPSVSGYQASPTTFSPNGDSKADTTTFSGSFDRFMNWTLAIKDGSETVLRSYSGSGISLSQVWDGKDSAGALAPTGTYTSTLSLADIDNLSSTASASVYLDRTGPAISAYAVSPNPFSPNADAVKDTTTFSATLSDPSTPVSWTLAIKNGGGTTVRSFSGTGTSVSQAWDGKDSAGVAVPDGAYTGTLDATDPAGNRQIQNTSVTVDTVAPTISGYAVSPNPFSPNGDGVKDTTTFTASLSDPSNPISWSLKINYPSGVTVRSYSGTGASVSQVWDGKNGAGEVVINVTYTGALAATDAAGNIRTQHISVTVDTQAPGISQYAASPNPFSPNGDAAKDTTTFSAVLYDTSPPVTWTLAIKNVSGTTVRSYSGTVQSLPPWGTGIQQVWDGKDSLGAVVPDGTYTGELTATDDQALVSSAPTTVTVDTVAPTVSGYVASPNPFSPNGDGTKDTTTFSATLSDPSAPISWTLEIKDALGATLRSYSGSGSPVAQGWDGKDSVGVVVDGMYTGTLTPADAAGNTAASASTSVTVDTVAPSITGYAASPNPFSPNGDGVKDTTTFSATLSDPSAPVAWTIEVKNSLGTVVRSFSGSGSVVFATWDGKDSLGVVVPSGTYTATLAATDMAGNRRAEDTLVTVDTLPPTITGFSASPNPFSPNGDGVKDTTTFSATLSEPSSWSLEVLNGAGTTVRSFSGSGTAVVQSWDGKDPSGGLVPDGSYTALLTATDSQGNRASSSTGVLVDTAAPAVSGYAAFPNPFSPNGDGRKDTTTFGAVFSETASWTLAIKDGAGATLRSYSGSGSTLAQSWEGKNSLGGLAADGQYSGSLSPTDLAGNAALPVTALVAIDTVPPTLSNLAFSEPAISPNGDGMKDTTSISATVSEALPWTVAVRSGATTVRSFAGSGSTVSAVWDGTDGAGATVSDDTYDVVVTATDAADNAGSTAGQIRVDLTPPFRFGFEAYPNPFSPDVQAPHNTTTVATTLSEASQWTLQIANPTGTVVRSFSGPQAKVSVVWDGRDSAGDRVPNDAYRVTLQGADAVGNRLVDSLWLTVGPAPVISTITPSSSVQIGGLITIIGENLGPGLGVHGVTVQGRSAFLGSWGPTRITAYLPPDLTPGPADVSVWAADLTSMPVSIDIAKYSIPADGASIIPGRIAVRIREGADPALIALRQGDPSSAITREFPGTSDPVMARWYRVEVPAGQERDKARAYAADPDVEFAEVHAPFQLDRTPNDLNTNQWGLEQSSDIDIDAEQAWEVSVGSTSVVIAVLDSGIGPHEDIVANRLPGKSYQLGSISDDDACTNTVEGSHGTTVAGIASADTNNGRGVAGTGWQSKVRPYRIGTAAHIEDGSVRCRMSTGINTLGDIIDDVIANGDDVVNMSFGGPGPYSQQEQDAMRRAWNSGLVLVAAAGNEGGTPNATVPRYPAAYDFVLAVGAHNRAGAIADFSSRGDWVHLYAPGTDIYTTVLVPQPNGTVRQTYQGGNNGTSFAAPFVSGTAALLMDRGANNVHAYLSILKTLQGDPPRLNAGAALARAAGLVYPNGTWIKDRSDTQPQVYYLDGGNKRPVPSSQVLASWGVAMSDVVRVSKAELDQYRLWPSPVGFRPGTLIAPVPSTSDQLGPGSPLGTFAVTNGSAAGASQTSRWTRGFKYRILPAFFECLGYDPRAVRLSSFADANLHGTAGDWADCTRHPNGAILKHTNQLSTPAVWMLQDGRKRLVQAASFVGSWGMARDAALSSPLVDDELNKAATGAYLGYRPGVVVRVESPVDRWAITPDGTDLARGIKRRFNPASAYSCYGYTREIGAERREYVSNVHPTTGTDLVC